MPGPSDRVLVDPDRMRVLVSSVAEAGDLLRSWSRSLVAALTDAGLPPTPAERLGALEDEVKAEVTMLRRRLRLAEGVDDGIGITIRPTSAPLRRPVHREAPGIPGTSEAPRTSEQAVAAGRALAHSLRGDEPDRHGSGRHGTGRGGTGRGGTGGNASGMVTPRDALTVLRSRMNDPDFVLGFHDALGPDGLARLLYRVEGLSRGPMVHRPPEPLGFDRREAERILGATLASYSHRRTLDAAWLGRFNTAGRTDTAETVLLTPLLASARLDSALLDRLGRMAFGPGDRPGNGPGDAAVAPSAPHDVGLLAPAAAGPTSRGRPTVTDYQGVLLDAIAATPALAARFAADHIDTILRGAAVLALPLPVDLATARSLEDAWIRLVAAAGSQESRRADPRASASFVSRLAGAVQATGDRPLLLRLRAALVPALRTYRDELYDAVTAVVPGPTVDPQAGAAAAQSALVELIPLEAWESLLRECLRGGALAGLLAQDVTTYGLRLDDQVAASVQGWKTAPGGYSSSPLALGYLRVERAQAFFAGALADATEAVLREHADAVGAHRRQQAVLLDVLGEVGKSIDPTNPPGTFVHLGVGVTVEMIEAWIRARYSDLPTTRPAQVVADLRDASRVLPGWAAAYETSARRLWARRDRDPLRPIAVAPAGGPCRVYTGDPRADGFITSPAENFLDASGNPRPSARMTPTQRRAYAAWLASPAMVANNDRISFLDGRAGSRGSSLPPDWGRRPG
ncbi:hypothetical protein Manayef4_05740 [Frankia sp. CgMI4]|uniref:hypothetical protein n=1 Tax=Frankia sp. CgMI4 TaxID=1742262 RepID=UPI0008733F80|nr:hypothetical protein [Frankia sp. CgIM4]OFB38674.1 hypothetical protein Manayef4_05740 [Frankia sp. CgIM4]